MGCVRLMRFCYHAPSSLDLLHECFSESVNHWVAVLPKIHARGLLSIFHSIRLCVSALAGLPPTLLHPHSASGLVGVELVFSLRCGNGDRIARGHHLGTQLIRLCGSKAGVIPGLRADFAQRHLLGREARLLCQSSLDAGCDLSRERGRFSKKVGGR